MVLSTMIHGIDGLELVEQRTSLDEFDGVLSCGGIFETGAMECCGRVVVGI